MKLNFVIQARVESSTGLNASVTVEVLDLTKKGAAADVIFSQRHRVSTDNFATQVDPLLRNALTHVSNTIINTNNQEINRNAR